jgi:hypothetical protein
MRKIISEEAMTRPIFAVCAFILAVTGAYAAEGARPMRFWNLTLHTISEFQLAPAGSGAWGENQTKNDKDGTVDSDERLRITGIGPGVYDARLISGSLYIRHHRCLVSPDGRASGIR